MATSPHDNWISSSTPRRQGLAEILAAWLDFPPPARPRDDYSSRWPAPVHTALPPRQVVSQPGCVSYCAEADDFPAIWGKAMGVAQEALTAQLRAELRMCVLTDKNAGCGLDVYIVLSKAGCLSAVHILETPDPAHPAMTHASSLRRDPPQTPQRRPV